MTKKKIALALQGGGSYGAFTWGVLEAILEDERFEIDSISGTSAGALNGVALTQGLIQGGHQGAIDTLYQLWEGANKIAKTYGCAFHDPFGSYFGDYNLKGAPAYILFPYMKYFFSEFSPYMWNSFNINPLSNLLDDLIDYQAIRKHSELLKLFLAATHVESGKIKIFKNEDVNLDVLLAVTAIPALCHAVTIKGESYWDGGLIANPAIYPLIYEGNAKDIIVVQVTNLKCPFIPKKANDIRSRYNEIILNSCLTREIRAINFVSQLIDSGKIIDPSVRRINLHLIRDDIFFANLEPTSILNMDMNFLQTLHRAGYNAAKKWIKLTFDKLGEDIPIDNSAYDDYL